MLWVYKWKMNMEEIAWRDGNGCQWISSNGRPCCELTEQFNIPTVTVWRYRLMTRVKGAIPCRVFYNRGLHSRTRNATREIPTEDRIVILWSLYKWSKVVTFRICTKLWANKPTRWCDNQRAGRDWLLGYFTLRTPEATFRVRLLVFTGTVLMHFYIICSWLLIETELYQAKSGMLIKLDAQPFRIADWC